ncbi:MAG: hypothetical protein COB94_002130 [Gammaproteobacteria bacterium]|nr:hypothetical protein [Gammaproteobacteria bacterium]
MMRLTQSKTLYLIVLILCVGCSAEPEVNVAQVWTANNTVTADVLRLYCSDCHVAPKPITKTASEWPAIVLRMQAHRSQQAMPVLNDVETDEVVRYLMKNSKDG